jgi:hypothetical protein
MLILDCAFGKGSNADFEQKVAHRKNCYIAVTIRTSLAEQSAIHWSSLQVASALRRVTRLDETGERGGKPRVTAETDKRILVVLDRTVRPNWSTSTCNRLGVSCARRRLISRHKSWCESDPAFRAKATEIVGLYLDPPDGALMLVVDEKPSIQCAGAGLSQAPNGRALGHSRDWEAWRFGFPSWPISRSLAPP